MKQKIKEALQQGYKNLGLKDEVLERVAASVETFISDESDIQKYVDSELVKNLMKFEQADADRKRTKREKDAKGEGEKAAENGNGNPENSEAEQMKSQTKTLDITSIVAQAVAAAITPLQNELAAFKTAQSQKSAVAALNELKNTWDYAKGYPSECKDAYERTMELYEVGGKMWNADELKAKFTEKFNKAVSRKGVDTSKPFPSDGGGSSEAEKNKAFADEIRAALGIDKD